MNKYQLRRLASAALILAIGLFAAGTARAQNGNANDVSGTLTSHQVTTGCTSPIGVCTAGTLTGDLAGTFAFTAGSVIFLPDGVTAVFDGTTVITTAQGTITGHDHTVANLATGAIVDTITILSSTGEWSGASGLINIVGTFSFATGTGSSTYSGAIFFPQNR